MITKIARSERLGNDHIAVLYPGNKISPSDSGLGSIGRIDQANMPAGITIKMHPHRNDEILSYFRTGEVGHTDSAGVSVLINRKKLMLMRAGKVFYHEEHIAERLEGLQIFIRPKRKDYSPEVLFYDLTETDSKDDWRLIASPNDDGLLTFSSETWIYDRTTNSKSTFQLPELPKAGLTALLYVFQGSTTVNGAIHLGQGDSLIIKDELIGLVAGTTTELVLFFTDEEAEYFAGGMFSRNKS